MLCWHHTRGPTNYSTLNRATTMLEAAVRPRGKGRLEGEVLRLLLNLKTRASAPKQASSHSPPPRLSWFLQLL